MSRNRRISFALQSCLEKGTIERHRMQLLKAINYKGIKRDSNAEKLREEIGYFTREFGPGALNCVGICDEAPLVVAAAAGKADIMQLLIDHGADVNCQIADYYSFEGAMLRRKTWKSCLDVLLEGGFTLAHRTPERACNMILDVAALGNPQMIFKLRATGPGATVAGFSKRVALLAYQKAQNEETYCAVLQSFCPTVHPSLLQAVACVGDGDERNCSVAILKQLLRSDVNFSVQININLFLPPAQRLCTFRSEEHLQLLRMAAKTWSPARHHLFGLTARTNIFKAMLIRQRLLCCFQRGISHHAPPAQSTTESSCLFVLPDELWFAICELIPSSRLQI